MTDFVPPTFPERFNMADWFLDARVREGRGGRSAVKVGDRSWTYSEVQSLGNRVSHGLRDRGIDLEDRVLLLLPDGIEFAVSWFGILKAGAVFCMGNPLAPADDLDYLLGYARARAVIAHASVMDRLADPGRRGARHLRLRQLGDGRLDLPARRARRVCSASERSTGRALRACRSRAADASRSARGARGAGDRVRRARPRRAR